MFALLALLANLAVTVVSAQDLNNIHRFNKRLSSGCGLNWPVSCSANPPPSDLCCYESPGGLLLQTQFWDTNPSTGPSNSWTIHFSNLYALSLTEQREQAFGQTTVMAPFRSSVTRAVNTRTLLVYVLSPCSPPSLSDVEWVQLLESQGAGSTLSFMEEYWISNSESNEAFWEHEWAAHGTCYSTLEPSCLPSGSPTGAEAVAFFEQAVALFQTLPTYSWLESQGITPSTTQTHTLSQLNSALKTASGFTPALGCSGSTIDSISWYFHLQGSLLDGEFIPIDTPVASRCPSTGLKYPPKA